MIGIFSVDMVHPALLKLTSIVIFVTGLKYTKISTGASSHTRPDSEVRT